MPALADGLKHWEAESLPEPELDPHEPVLSQWKSELPEKLMQIWPPELVSLPPPFPPPHVDAGAELEAAGGATLDEGGAAGGFSATFSWTFAGGVGAPWPTVIVTTAVADSQTVTISSPRMLAGPAVARR